MLAGHGDLNHAAASGSLVLGVLQLLLLGLHLFLHLLGLAHQGVHVGLAKALGQSCFHGCSLLSLFVIVDHVDPLGREFF